MSTTALSVTNPLVITIIVLSVIVIVLAFLVIWMYIKMKRFLIDVDSDNISDSLTYVSSGLKDLQNFRIDLEDYLQNVESRLKRSIQSVNTVRFNPYKGTGEGGNQSFATAFLNEEGNGVVVSSLHSRDHVRVFSKPIREHRSEYELSEEEQQAIDAGRILVIKD